MLRYKSSYGGTETIVGIFSCAEVNRKYGVTLPLGYEEGKVLDIMEDKREVIGYMVDDTHIELRVINS